MTVGYLVDTDWIIDHFNGVASITEYLKQLRPAGLGISIVSLAELYEGVHYSRDPERSEITLQRFLAGVSVLSLDEEICRVFGRERGRLRRLGKMLGDFDLLIAATCLRHGLQICTNNRRHFDMVDGLRIVSL